MSETEDFKDHYLALQIKAVDDWHKSFIKLSSIQKRLIKNPKGKFAVSLFECIENWGSHTISQKYDALRFLVNAISIIYNLPNVSFHTPSSWKRYNQEHFKSGYEEYVGNAMGFYFFHTAESGDFINVIVRDWDQPDCYKFIRILTHEIAHAIIENECLKYPDISKIIKDKWLNTNLILNPFELDPLLTIGHLKYLEENTPSLGDQKRQIIHTMLNSNDWDNYTNYAMLWEERCCESFAQQVNIILKAAHLFIQSQKNGNNLIETAENSLNRIIDKCRNLERMANTDFNYKINKKTKMISHQDFRDIIYDAHHSWSTLERSPEFQEDVDIGYFIELQNDIIEDFYALYKIFDEF
jgi:hypothetical protein